MPTQRVGEIAARERAPAGMVRLDDRLLQNAGDIDVHNAAQEVVRLVVEALASRAVCHAAQCRSRKAHEGVGVVTLEMARSSGGPHRCHRRVLHSRGRGRGRGMDLRTLRGNTGRHDRQRKTQKKTFVRCAK